MVVVERQWLLAVNRVFGMVHVENQVLWRAGEAGDELLDQGLADAVDVLAAGGMFEARHRGRRSERGGVIERQAVRTELEHRIVAQAVRVVTILVAAADLKDSLCQQVAIGMADVALVTTIVQGFGDALGQSDLPIDAAQQQRAKVGRQTAAGEVGANGMRWNGCKTELF